MNFSCQFLKSPTVFGNAQKKGRPFIKNKLPYLSVNTSYENSRSPNPNQNTKNDHLKIQNGRFLPAVLSKNAVLPPVPTSHEPNQESDNVHWMPVPTHRMVLKDSEMPHLQPNNASILSKNRVEKYKHQSGNVAVHLSHDPSIIVIPTEVAIKHQ